MDTGKKAVTTGMAGRSLGSVENTEGNRGKVSYFGDYWLISLYSFKIVYKLAFFML